jgi:phage baseplate assembly protein W
MPTFNIKFPLNDDSVNNTYFQLSTLTKEAFSSDLLLLLLTQKGERYYQPDYGTNLLKYIFEPNDNMTAVDVEQDIKKTVALYIPALTVNSVTFNRNTDDYGNIISDNQLNVNIKFTYSEDVFSEQGELDLNF